MSERGLFITFEGSEGCGKSSGISSLAAYFASVGRECVITREPGGTPLAEDIRGLLLSAKKGANMSYKTELLLFAAARAQHVEELILPALNSGKIVLCDRFMDSTSAYQGVARNLGQECSDMLNAFAVGSCVPDMTLLLDLDPELGLQRARFRDEGCADRMGSQKLEFYRAVRQAFLELAKKHGERFVLVDSSGEKEETFAQILSAVKERFNV